MAILIAVVLSLAVIPATFVFGRVIAKSQSDPRSMSGFAVNCALLVEVVLDVVSAVIGIFG
jgi:FlaG/FlaF family flagellin (archaellin)